MTYSVLPLLSLSLAFFSIYPNFHLHFSIHTIAENIENIRLFNMCRIGVAYERDCCIHIVFSSWYTCYWPMLLAFPWIIRTKTSHNTVRWATNFAKWKLIEKVLSECLLVLSLPLTLSLQLLLFFFFNQWETLQWNFKLFSLFLLIISPIRSL